MQRSFWTILLSTTFILSLLFTAAMSAVPPYMNYQGRLTDSGGNPIDTTAAITFTIYDDYIGGTPLWSETHPSVVVTDGLFSVLLGTVVQMPPSVFDGSDRFLAIQLGAGPENDPRVLIASVAHARRAEYADTAAYAHAGPASGSPWTSNGSAAYLNNSSLNVGIGTSSPTSKLVVDGDIWSTGVGAFGGPIYGRKTLAAYASGTSDTFAVWGTNTNGTAAGFYSNTPANVAPGTPTAVYARAGGDAIAGNFSALGDGMGLNVYSAGSGDALRAFAAGSSYSGRFGGGLGVLVSGDLLVTGASNLATVNVGSPSLSKFLYHYRSGIDTRVAYVGSNSSGGNMAIYDELNNPLAGWFADTDGEGGYMYVRRSPSANGFYVDGNNSGSNEPKVAVYGSQRQAIFDMSATADASVVLPDSSISSAEILNEPGIAVESNGSATLLSTTGVDIETVTITIPTAGYIHVTGFCMAQLFNYPNSHTASFQINDVALGAQLAPYVKVGLDSYGTNGMHRFSVATQNVFYKVAGTHTFYFNGRHVTPHGPESGDANGAHARMVAVFYPTSYGTVKATVSASDAALFDNAELVLSDNNTEPLYQVDLRELELKAARARAEVECAERELLEAQMRDRDTKVIEEAGR